MKTAPLPSAPPAALPPALTPLVTWTRALAVGSLLSLIVLGLAAVAGPGAPRRFVAGAEGIAAGFAAGRPVEKPHVHPPLGQPAGVALFHRRRGARHQRPRCGGSPGGAGTAAVP